MERINVLKGIIHQSQQIVEKLGDCKQKPTLKESEIRRGQYDKFFYHDTGLPKSKKELEEIKKQHMRNVSWSQEQLEKYNERG